ncbi:uncharacterized protein LY89DRAFT_682489 [Mollisia scopiformis]|uniref:Uncharacterized protein n=1 Tax=Mollisia scopiformis TaxID=149040 RepID=A0A194XKW4_MOLSC|nr:uncharacterized protein LY89DRAFT_682489 [Mollisia scopiformis]KUJ20818.1 hypothetical protein LY89DRAFT_682489 [Mollisia scopiformis]
MMDAEDLSLKDIKCAKAQSQHQDGSQHQSEDAEVSPHIQQTSTKTPGLHQDELQHSEEAICLNKSRFLIENPPVSQIFDISDSEASNSLDATSADSLRQRQDGLQKQPERVEVPLQDEYGSRQQSEESLCSTACNLSTVEESVGMILKGIEPTPDLADYDRGQTTRLLCLIGLVFAWLVCIACIVLGTLCLIKQTNSPWTDITGIVIKQPARRLYITGLSTTSGEALSFMTNVFVALATDSLGYIHATSLRWALFREGRLQFNTNLRLFTSTRKYAPNRWPANLISIISLILCYAASSQLFLRDAQEKPGIGPQNVVAVNGVAILTLALGIFGKASIATWIMASGSKHIPTWSSNALNNALVLTHHGLTREEERCMLSVDKTPLPPHPTKPLARGLNARNAVPSLRYIISLLWIWSLLMVIFFIILVVVSWFESVGYQPWSFSLACSAEPDPEFPEKAQGTYLIVNSVSEPWIGSLIIGILFLCAVQGLQTLGINAAELVINLSRDESTWKEVDRAKSSRRSYNNAFISAATSWQNMLLFAFKPVLHWMLGQTVVLRIYELVVTDSDVHGVSESENTYRYIFFMLYPRLFIYVIISMALAACMIFIAFRRPRGPQPTAYGHYQTLTNLIDDWTVNEKGIFWWGDKGVGPDGIRHAGTSPNREALGNIQKDALYA